MKCSHFGMCGSCNFYEFEYQEALERKKRQMQELYEGIYSGDIELFSSPASNHRARAEFKIWHEGKSCFYAMTNLDKDGVVKIDECPKLIEPIVNVQYRLLELINNSEVLKHKLFSVEFLASLKGDILVTLIYHKKLDEAWKQEAKALQEALNIAVIGRARKQKEIISKDYIEAEVKIDSKIFKYQYFDSGFTQPNPYINKAMISWALGVASGKDDLIEAYCGLGNFTIPLSRHFNRVLATEVSKTSIKNAKVNCELNGVDNIEFIRLNASETAQALRGDREFNRLRGVDLKRYNFSTILVDPPRAGLDEDSLKLSQSIDNIIYISCNPQTLIRDLKELTKTHKIKRVAMFDQFPYTTHIENGVYLERI